MRNLFINIDTIISTDGKTSYWSNVAKEIRLTMLKISYVNEEEDFGELQVFFDKNTWSVEDDGLIYTDDTFEADLKIFLTNSLGLYGDDINYSEQGMQGNDYVSFDIGEQFLKSWKEYQKQFQLTSC